MLILHDGNPLTRIRRPWVNMALMAGTAAVFALQLLDAAAWQRFAFFPAQLWHLWPQPGPLYGIAGLITYPFLHGNLLHVGANLIALRVFGDNLEDAMGHWRYLLFYLASAAFAAAAQGLLADPFAPLIGASGAVSAVMGGYLLLHPRARILILAFNVAPVIAPAAVVVGFQIAVNFAMSWNLVLFAGAPPDPGAAAVAWWAHIGGFVSGMALVPLLKASGVPLFQAPALPERGMRWLGRYVPTLSWPGERAPVEAGAERPPRRAGLEVFVKALAYVALIVVLMRYL